MRDLSVVIAAVLVVGACSTIVTVEPSPTAVVTVEPSPTPPGTASPVAPSGVRFDSERYRYGLLLPDGWTIVETPGSGGLHPDEPGVDTLRDSARIVSIVGESVAVGSSLDGWSCAIGRHLAGEHATPVESTAALIVAGRPARLTRYHLVIDPYVIHYLNVELINGDIGLTISMESTAHDDAEDEAVLRALLDSVTLTSGA